MNLFKDTKILLRPKGGVNEVSTLMDYYARLYDEARRPGRAGIYTSPDDFFVPGYPVASYNYQTADAVRTHVQKCFDKEKQIQEQIEAVTTVEELKAVKWEEKPSSSTPAMVGMIPGRLRKDGDYNTIR